MSVAGGRARAFLLNCRLPQWSCSTSRRPTVHKWQQCRHFQTSQSPRSDDTRFRPYYVTSPIFYVNAEPHAGHLYTLLLTDVLKRWEVLKGDRDAALLTGTDEHGMKVQKAAEKAQLDPKELCDRNAAQFLALAEDANISFDRFIRTTDPDHKYAVEHFWKELKKRDYIYESIHEGWYSVSDETFYPQSQVHLILEPRTGRKIFVSKETGKEVEWTSEINYRFRLSAFKARLLEHYDQHPDFIVPVQRMNSIKAEVEAGLEDLSVSRPSSRLQWGIRVPDDESQTIYVWLDALINYLTMTGYPHTNGNKYRLWPPNVQVIGKDIVRFHTIYWPAFLMALDLPLPRSFLTHAHWTMNKTKMSKSLGNGVNPFLAMSRYGRDTIRYFMIHDGGIVDDSDYDNSYIVERYKKDLQSGLGNLIARLIRSREWSVRQSIVQASTEESLATKSELVSEMIAFIDKTAATADTEMGRPNPRAALRAIMDLVYEANRFFSAAAPWNLTRNAQPERLRELHLIIYTIAEAVRVVCILLQPFIPEKMTQALDELGVAQNKRSFDHAAFGRDVTYGENVSERHQQKRAGMDHQQYTKRNPSAALFPALVLEF